MVQTHVGALLPPSNGGDTTNTHNAVDPAQDAVLDVLRSRQLGINSTAQLVSFLRGVAGYSTVLAPHDADEQPPNAIDVEGAPELLSKTIEHASIAKPESPHRTVSMHILSQGNVSSSSLPPLAPAADTDPTLQSSRPPLMFERSDSKSSGLESSLNQVNGQEQDANANANDQDHDPENTLFRRNSDESLGSDVVVNEGALVNLSDDGEDGESDGDDANSIEDEFIRAARINAITNKYMGLSDGADSLDVGGVPGITISSREAVAPSLIAKDATISRRQSRLGEFNGTLGKKTSISSEVMKYFKADIDNGSICMTASTSSKFGPCIITSSSKHTASGKDIKVFVWSPHGNLAVTDSGTDSTVGNVIFETLRTLISTPEIQEKLVLEGVLVNHDNDPPMMKGPLPKKISVQVQLLAVDIIKSQYEIVTEQHKMEIISCLDTMSLDKIEPFVVVDVYGFANPESRVLESLFGVDVKSFLNLDDSAKRLLTDLKLTDDATQASETNEDSTDKIDSTTEGASAEEGKQEKKMDAAQLEELREVHLGLMTEMISHEKNFIESLKMINVYHKKLVARLSTQEEIDTFMDSIPSVDTLITMDTVFVSEMENIAKSETMDSFAKIIGICNLFDRSFKGFNLKFAFSSYIEDLSKKASSRVDAKYSKHFISIKNENGLRLDYPSCKIQPVQRIAHFQLYFDKLVNSTCPGNPDYDAVKRTQDLLKNVGNEINSIRSNGSGNRLLSEIDRRLQAGGIILDSALDYITDVKVTNVISEKQLLISIFKNKIVICEPVAEEEFIKHEKALRKKYGPDVNLTMFDENPLYKWRYVASAPLNDIRLISISDSKFCMYNLKSGARDSMFNGVFKAEKRRELSLFLRAMYMNHVQSKSNNIQHIYAQRRNGRDVYYRICQNWSGETPYKMGTQAVLMFSDLLAGEGVEYVTKNAYDVLYFLYIPNGGDYAGAIISGLSRKGQRIDQQMFNEAEYSLELQEGGYIEKYLALKGEYSIKKEACLEEAKKLLALAENIDVSSCDSDVEIDEAEIGCSPEDQDDMAIFASTIKHPNVAVFDGSNLSSNSSLVNMLSGQSFRQPSGLLGGFSLMSPFNQFAGNRGSSRDFLDRATYMSGQSSRSIMATPFGGSQLLLSVPATPLTSSEQVVGDVSGKDAIANVPIDSKVSNFEIGDSCSSEKHENAHTTDATKEDACDLEAKPQGEAIPESKPHDPAEEIVIAAENHETTTAIDKIIDQEATDMVDSSAAVCEEDARTVDANPHIEAVPEMELCSQDAEIKADQESSETVDNIAVASDGEEPKENAKPQSEALTESELHEKSLEIKPNETDAEVTTAADNAAPDAVHAASCNLDATITDEKPEAEDVQESKPHDSSSDSTNVADHVSPDTVENIAKDDAVDTTEEASLQAEVVHESELHDKAAEPTPVADIVVPDAVNTAAASEENATNDAPEPDAEAVQEMELSDSAAEVKTCDPEAETIPSDGHEAPTIVDQIADHETPETVNNAVAPDKDAEADDGARPLTEVVQESELHSTVIEAKLVANNETPDIADQIATAGEEVSKDEEAKPQLEAVQESNLSGQAVEDKPSEPDAAIKAVVNETAVNETAVNETAVNEIAVNETVDTVENVAMVDEEDAKSEKASLHAEDMPDKNPSDADKETTSAVDHIVATADTDVTSEHVKPGAEAVPELCDTDIVPTVSHETPDAVENKQIVIVEEDTMNVDDEGEKTLEKAPCNTEIEPMDDQEAQDTVDCTLQGSTEAPKNASRLEAIEKQFAQESKNILEMVKEAGVYVKYRSLIDVGFILQRTVDVQHSLVAASKVDARKEREAKLGLLLAFLINFDTRKGKVSKTNADVLQIEYSLYQESFASSVRSKINKVTSLLSRTGSIASSIRSKGRGLKR